MKNNNEPNKSTDFFKGNDSPLIAIYDSWVKEVLGEGVKTEPEVTCQDCVMLPKSEADKARPDLFFNPQTKCCTYAPQLPNFLVGLILLDSCKSMTQGRDLVRQSIRKTHSLNSPLGLLQDKLIDKTKQEFSEEFGNNSSLICPYYKEANMGGCSIWKYRNSICQSWFCKHAKGKGGYRFWRAIKKFLNFVESQLALYCLFELGLDEATIYLNMKNVTLLNNGTPREAIYGLFEYEELWGAYCSKEETFYKECGKIVSSLSYSDVKKIVGVQCDTHEIQLKWALKEMNHVELPPYIDAVNLEVEELTEGYVGLKSYSPYDPVEIPQRVFNVLHYFNEYPLHEALRVIEEKEEVALSFDDIELLLNFEVLKPSQNR